MIRIMGLTKDSKVISDLTLDELKERELQWYWIDFDTPTKDESLLLKEYFSFHPLAIEDCLHFLQRPKVDFYDTYNFFVLHSLNQDTLEPEELDMFVGESYIVTFHLGHSNETDRVWDIVIKNKTIEEKNHSYIAYLVMDELVDAYFPAIHKIEDDLNDLDDIKFQSISSLIDQLFTIRGDLLKFRRVVSSMSDLLYRILNSTHLQGFKDSHLHFRDIYDHLLKLSEMAQANREITADIRDSYLSINSDRMNRIMMFFTVITSIFIPLTLISGIYGMNFKYMPELQWKYGYFMVLGIMAIISISMVFLFKRKGWFNRN